MKRKYIFILTLFFLSNCAAPSSVSLLGPIFTASKTGNLYQSSLSFGSSKILNDFKSDKIYINQNPSLPDIPYVNKNPKILIAYYVDKIEITEVNEPEPLP